MKSHYLLIHYMNEVIVVIGIVVFAIGLWYDFGTFIYAFVEPKGYTASWNDLVLPVTATSAGIVLAFFGIRTDRRLRPLKNANKGSDSGWIP